MKKWFSCSILIFCLYSFALAAEDDSPPASLLGHVFYRHLIELGRLHIATLSESPERVAPEAFDDPRAASFIDLNIRSFYVRGRLLGRLLQISIFIEEQATINTITDPPVFQERERLQRIVNRYMNELVAFLLANHYKLEQIENRLEILTQEIAQLDVAYDKAAQEAKASSRNPIMALIHSLFGITLDFPELLFRNGLYYEILHINVQRRKAKAEMDKLREEFVRLVASMRAVEDGFSAVSTLPFPHGATQRKAWLLQLQREYETHPCAALELRRPLTPP